MTGIYDKDWFAKDAQTVASIGGGTVEIVRFGYFTKWVYTLGKLRVVSFLGDQIFWDGEDITHKEVPMHSEVGQFVLKLVTAMEDPIHASHTRVFR